MREQGKQKRGGWGLEALELTPAGSNPAASYLVVEKEMERFYDSFTPGLDEFIAKFCYTFDDLAANPGVCCWVYFLFLFRFIFILE